MPLVPVTDETPQPVRRIAVFRALQLGDLLCAVPALRALRVAHPQAEIALIGLPWAAGWVQRMDCVDRWFEFPGWPGLPERTPDLRAIPAFMALMQECRFDLALQLHGAGSLVNPLVASFGARSTAGFTRDGEPVPQGMQVTRWPDGGHEIERCLALTDSLGIARQGTELSFPLLPCDRAAVLQRWPQLALRPFAVVHAGAQLPSRRWPVERFAQVAAALIEAGYMVVATGTADERPLAQALALQLPPAARAALLDLTGQTSLWQLGAVIERAQLVVCNDTGVSHVAAALKRPSVVVSSGADVARWAPLDRARHRVLWHHTACRPCAHRVCPTAHECAQGVGTDAVIEAAFAQLALHRPPRLDIDETHAAAA